MQCGEALPLPSKTSPLQKIKVPNVDVLKDEISKTKILLLCVCKASYVWGVERQILGKGLVSPYGSPKVSF